MKKNIEITHEQTSWCLLILIIIFIAVIRYSLVAVPFERDEGEYAYAGQLILKGIPPYKEVFNMKLPGIYYAYALLLSVFGQTHQGVHTGLIVINLITTVFVFLLAKQMMNRLGALFSAACFAFMSLLEPVQGLSANAEHFVILFSVLGLFVLLRALSGNSLPKIFFSGILLGFAFIMKQHGIAFCVLGGIFILFFFLSDRPVSWHRLVLNQVLFCAGILSVYFMICLLMLKYGVFRSFWFWTVIYAKTYVSQLSLKDAFVNFFVNADSILSSAVLLWIIIGMGFLMLLSRKLPEKHKVFLFLFVIFSFLSLCSGGFFRPHYFIMLLPSVSLLGGVAVNYFPTALNSFFSVGKTNVLVIVVIVFLFASSMFSQRGYLFFMNSLQISRFSYGLDPLVESLSISEFIKQNTKGLGKY